MSPVPPTIRPYRPGEDDAQIRWLHDRTPAAGSVAIEPIPWHDDLERIEEAYLAFWVATERMDDAFQQGREAIVGMTGLIDAFAGDLGVAVPDFMRSSRRTARLERMRVAPERQRRGIGRALLECAIAWARDAGYESMILETTPQQEAAIATYAALGFEERGRSMHNRWELVWMERAL